MKLEEVGMPQLGLLSDYIYNHHIIRKTKTTRISGVVSCGDGEIGHPPLNILFRASQNTKCARPRLSAQTNGALPASNSRIMFYGQKKNKERAVSPQPFLVHATFYLL
jgi:hypothetical protein